MDTTFGTTSSITSYMYHRLDDDGATERHVILVATSYGGHRTLLHQEHARGEPRNLLLHSAPVRLSPGQSVEAWLAERERQLRDDGWGPPERFEGIR